MMKKTRIQTRNMMELSHSYLSIATKDEKTGVLIEMSKIVDERNEL